MKRILSVMLMVAAFTVMVSAKYYSYKPAAIQIDIPSGWSTEEKDDKGDYLLVSSPNSEVLIYVAYYFDGGWGSYSAEEEYAFLGSFLNQYLNQEVTVSDSFEENINGMKVYAIVGSYEDASYGKAYVYCGAFETGKQLSVLIVDVLEKDLKKYKDTFNKVIDSAKKIK